MQNQEIGMDIAAWFPSLLLLLSFTTWWTFTSASYQHHHSQPSETNKPHKIHLCGQEFLDAYLWTCKLKSKLRITTLKRRKKRQVDLVESSEARNFFHPLRRRFRRSFGDGGTDDANEECCMEGCNVHEIAEYQCHI